MGGCRSRLANFECIIKYGQWCFLGIFSSWRWCRYGLLVAFGSSFGADGSKEMDSRLNAVLTNDPKMGIYRHADAGYKDAIENSKNGILKSQCLKNKLDVINVYFKTRKYWISVTYDSSIQKMVSHKDLK